MTKTKLEMIQKRKILKHMIDIIKENSKKTQIKPKNRITNHKTESKCPATQKFFCT